ncbi:MAG: hypothetical protein PHP93_00045 [Kiritimatiellales bacterium]|nr:hypothetical protein [Kiritimatiellales bacterium]
MKWIMSLILAAVLVGCTTTPPFDWNNVELIGGRIRTTRDEYKKLDKVTGPKYIAFRTSSFAIDKNDLSYFLRAFRPENGRWTCQLYVIHAYDYSSSHPSIRRREINGYREAFGADGQMLDFDRIDLDIDLGSSTVYTATEEFAVNLPVAYLEKHRLDGLNIRADGKNWSTICQLPSAYVQAFLQKLSERSPSAP